MPDLPDPVNAGTTTVANQSPPKQTAAVGGGSATTSGIHKEQDALPRPEVDFGEPVTADVEVAPELKAAGVESYRETVELPPDVAQLGVTHSGVSAPMTVATTIQLPLTDEQIERGLHAKILLSIRWLAQWCLRQLKKAHYHLKTIGGKVVRESDKNS